MKLIRILFIFFLALIFLLPSHAGTVEPGASAGKAPHVSDHFDGQLYFNPGAHPSPPALGQGKDAAVSDGCGGGFWGPDGRSGRK